jgi:hypothetical protein
MFMMALWRKKHSDPESGEWSSVALRVVNRWTHLAPSEREQVLQQAADFSSDRRWEGLDGLEITSTMQAIVSVHACLLTVKIGLGNLRDVTSVLMVPGPSRTTSRHLVGGSIITESEATVIGQAALHGPVRLSWQQVASESRPGSTTSVVLHEFAHKIDMADGVSDGNPPIRGHGESLEFERILSGVLQTLRSEPDGGPLREYGSTNRSELFAVATEAFFLTPRDLQSQFGDLYEALAGFYLQTP